MRNSLHNIENKINSCSKKASILKIISLSISTIFLMNSDSYIESNVVFKNIEKNKNMFNIQNGWWFANNVCSPIDTLWYYYYINGLHEEALDIYQQKLDTAIACKDIYNQWSSYTEIWLLYRDQWAYDYALKYYEDALSVLDTNSTRDFIANLHDISLIYYWKWDIQNYKFYLEKALSKLLASTDETLTLDEWTFNLYINLCNYYFNHTEDIKKAREYLDKAHNIVINTENPLNEVVYLTWEWDFFYKNWNYDEFLKFYFKALDLAKSANNKLYQKIIYYTIVSFYKESYVSSKNVKDLEKKDYYESLFDIVSAELSNEQLNNRMAALNVKFDVEKLKSENEKKQSELVIQQQKTKTARAWWSWAWLLALGAIWFGAVLKRKNQTIALQNAELEQSNEEIRAINDELNEKNGIIEKSNKEITSSISYASIIQKALLYNDVERHFPNSFVYHKPKDIVGWDFYLSAETPTGKKMLISADCTGHGVPWAFLTLFGSATVRQFLPTAKEPSDIINGLDCKFMEQYWETKESNTDIIKTEDSMDIACVFYDPQTRILEYSLSSRPIILLRNGEIIKLTSEVRADVWSTKKPHWFEWYKTYQEQLQPWDEIFLSSDWVSDQYIIKNDKKLLARWFYELLYKLSKLPIKQRAKYTKKFYSEIMKQEDWTQWMQTDDILLIWFKV